MILLVRRTALAVRLLLAAALLVGGVGLAAAQTQPFTSREEKPEDFPDVPGREEAFYTCTACHDFNRVARLRMSRERWDTTLDNMAADHGMPKLDEAERTTILDYLARAFPELTPAQRGWQNPFLKN